MPRKAYLEPLKYNRLKITRIILSAQIEEFRNVTKVALKSASGPAQLSSRKLSERPACIGKLRASEASLRYLNSNLLGGLLLLLLLLLSLSLILLCRGSFFYWRGCFFLLLLFLDGNEKTDDILGLDHIIFIDLEFTEDVVNLSLGHLVPPGHQGVLEHLGINLALLVVGLESLDNEVIGVVSVSGHLLLEHLDHVVICAGTSNLAKETVKFSLAHEDTNVVKSTTEVIFVKLAILIDVHELEAVLVHLELVLGEPSLILALAHLEVRVSSVVSMSRPVVQVVLPMYSALI